MHVKKKLMNKKIILFSSVIALFIGKSYAQQDADLTHFMFNKMTLNPGETGIDDGICGSTIYRNQWDKVNGAPNSAVLNIEANMNRFFPGGIGISFFHDAIGFNRTNNALLSYSYPLQVAGAGTLGIGLGVGIINMSNSPVWVAPETPIDNALPTGFGATNLDLNFGLYWKGTSDYYAGISSTHLSESVLSTTSGANTYNFNTARHYYVMGGKTFRNILSGDIDVQGLLRTDMIKMSLDINARYLWRNIAYGGLTYRTADAVALMLGWMPIRNMTVGYSYDINTHKLASVSRGSHEIMLKYCYFLPPPPVTKSNHPRWL